MPLLPCDQRTPEWYAARKGKLTASLAAAVLGLDPYTGPLAAFNRITKGTPQEDNKHMAWGREFEGPAREDYEVMSGHLVTETGFWTCPSLEWLGASPDGLIDADGLVEIKCPSVIPEQIPIHHEVQMRVQLACTEREWCDYFAWSQNGNLCRRVLRDDNKERVLLKKLEDFYESYIRPDIAPPRRRPT